MSDEKLHARIRTLWEAEGSGKKSGRFPIPGPVAALVCALAAPRPADTICDPCAGTCDLLVAAADHVRTNFPATLSDATESRHFHTRMFQGWESDAAMREAGIDALRAHGVDHARIRILDAIADSDSNDASKYSLVLCRVPFSGSVEPSKLARDVWLEVRSKRLELLILAHITKLLAPGGRAALIVPDSLLSGVTKAHLSLRRKLVEEHRVDAVIRLPAGIFKPHSNSAASVLLFARTEAGGTHEVWFYDAESIPGAADSVRTLTSNWANLRSRAPRGAEARGALSFCVPREEIAAQSYDLSLARYRLAVPAQIESRRPHEILAELAGIEAEIFQGMKDLVGMLK